VPVFQGLIRTPEAERNMDAILKARDGYSKAVAILDWWLADHAFLSGEAFGYGDIPAAPFVFRWFNLDIEREDYPHLKRWYDAVAARPPFKKHVIDTGLQ
jgi:glutathione S-transferase